MSCVRRQTLELDGRRSKDFTSILFRETHGFVFTGEDRKLVTDSFDLGGSKIRVSRVTSTGHRISLTELRDVTFLFPKSGTLAVRVANRASRFDHTMAAVVRPNFRETSVHRPKAVNFEGHVLMLPMTDVEKLAGVKGVDAMLRDVMSVRDAAAGRLKDYVGFLLSNLEASSTTLPSDRVVTGMVALLRDLIADCLDAGLGADASRRNAPATLDIARVRRAEEVMRLRLDEPLSIADLALDLGLSLRSLQLAFQSVHGEGPRATLNRIRLDLARSRLLQAAPPEKVTTVALDCGFTHLGRFAEAYLRRFGERPSDTLTRSRSPRSRQ